MKRSSPIVRSLTVAPHLEVTLDEQPWCHPQHRICGGSVLIQPGCEDARTFCCVSAGRSAEHHGPAVLPGPACELVRVLAVK